MYKNYMGEDYFTIKEFAELVGMTENALRLYDKKGIFRPAHRGVGAEGKYRYYSLSQITPVKMVRTLTEIGVPLNIIRELMENRSPEKLIKILTMNREKISDTICFLQEVHSVINTFLDTLIEGISITETNISVSVMPEKSINMGNVNDFGGAGSFFGAYTQFCREPHVPKRNLSYPVGGLFENMAAFVKEPSEPARFYSLDPNGQELKPQGRYLIGYTRGYYGQTNDLPQRMWDFAKKNGLRFNGPVYNIYLQDELSIVEPGQYLLQASVAVTETRRASHRLRLSY